MLDKDEDSLPYVFPGRITADAFQPDADLNPREIPIAMQLPDWNHWLPRIHPIDAWEKGFSSSQFSALYEVAQHRSDRDAAGLFSQWSRAQHAFLSQRAPTDPGKWSPVLMQKVYSSQLWQLVKTWEITQNFGLERRGRMWPNDIPARTAPVSANIPDGPNGMGGSALTNEYYTSSWYELQLLLNSGNHRHDNAWPISWPYFAGRFLKLYQQSRRPEPARLLIAVIKAMQSTDPGVGPEDVARGWRPERNIDPRIMVNSEFSAMFEPLAAGQKQAITDSLLAAWLDKNGQYRATEYFQRNLSANYSSRSYNLPGELRGIADGRPWEATAEFRASGVRPELIRRLVNWGDAYRDLSQLFHY